MAVITGPEHSCSSSCSWSSLGARQGLYLELSSYRQLSLIFLRKKEREREGKNERNEDRKGRKARIGISEEENGKKVSKRSAKANHVYITTRLMRTART